MTGYSRAVVLLLWSWLIRTALCYTYELRAHVTFTADTNDYNPDLVVGYFADYSKDTTQRRRGRLVLVDEEYGCPESNITLPPLSTTSSYIVALRLSGCNDYLQARKAEQDNAEGVVFFYTSNSARDSSSSGDSRLTIPVAVIEVGDDILGHITGHDAPLYSGVAIEGMQYAVFQQSRTFYFIVTAFCILILLSCLWFFTSYFRRCRYSLRNRRRQARAENTARKAISKLKVRSYRASKGSPDTDNCAVCLELYSNNDVIRVLPCRHEFHKRCVDPWLKLKHTCPLCKNNIINKSSSSSAPSSAEEEPHTPRHTNTHSPTTTAPSPSTNSLTSSSDLSSVGGASESFQMEMRLLPTSPTSISTEVAINLEEEDENIA